MKYPIVIIIENEIDYALFFEPVFIFKDGLPFLKDRQYTVIDADMNLFILDNYNVSKKIPLLDRRRIKVFFQSIYELSYLITFKRKISIDECTLILKKIVAANEIYFEDIDIDGVEMLEKMSKIKDDDAYFKCLLELAKIISSR